jgi:cobalt-zinc-cadmium efflux system protein
MHAHHHGNAHAGHAHPGAGVRSSAAFRWGIALNAGYVLVEAGVGLTVGSLGLVADAGHNASDVLALAVAWLGASLAARAPSERFTYGLKRSPVVASLLNALLLFAAMAVVTWEAFGRLLHPAPVPGGAVIWVALGGLLVNGGTALLFARGREDLNVRAAFLHMIADAAVTLAVLLAGIGILLTGATWLDPAITLVVAAVVLWSTWRLFAEALRRSLDAVPAGLRAVDIRRALERLPEVDEVHDLHVWGYGSNEVALTAHLRTLRPPEHLNALIADACRVIDEHFGIRHCTLQVESGEPIDPCGLRSNHTV